MEQKKIKKNFLKFTEKTSDFIDFYLINDDKKRLEKLTGIKNIESLEIIGAHSSKSLICQWDVKKSSTSPIVWMDTEGFPNTVIAGDYEEFLSILPYDTSHIYDMVSSLIHSREEKKLRKSMLKKYKKSTLGKFLKRAKKSYSNYAVFIDWLTKKMKIPICETPIELIENALDKNPDFQKYLDSLKRNK